MRVTHHLIRERSGLFYFRLRVPRDLQARMGARLIKRATGTRCPRTALACASLLAARYAQAFAAVRKGNAMTKPPSLDDILSGRSGVGGDNREWSGTVRLPNGAVIENAQVNGEADARLFRGVLDDIGQLPAGHHAYTATSTAATTPAMPVTRITLKDALTKWHGAIKNTDPKTIGAKQRALNDLLAWRQSALNTITQEQCGMEAPQGFVDEITGTVCGEWFIHLNSLRKLDPKTQKMVPHYSPGTMENKFIYAAGFFDWTIANGYYPKGEPNPARGHANVPKKVKKARAKSHGAQAFTHEQLRLMFQPEHYQRMKSHAARWHPLLLLYTGARSNEIGRLELADLYEYPRGCAEGSGTKVFGFSLVGDDKSLKNEDSERKTPIHPHLIALGFWDYVVGRKAAEKVANERVTTARKAKISAPELEALMAAEREAAKLFPTLTFSAQNGPSNGPQSAFRRMLKEAGIKARGAGKVGHHSFRDTAIDAMKQAGVPENMIDEYTGHDQGDENADAYEQKFPPATLATHCHPALDWGLDLKALKPLLLQRAVVAL
jgi:integrase